MNIKQKVRIKIQKINIDIFSNQILLESSDYLFQFIQTNFYDSKRFKTRRYYLPKGIIKNYNIIINGKNFYDDAIDSDIKLYEEIRKLTTGQGEGCTTECLLHYDNIKNYYKLIATDLNRLKELDADPKAIEQMEMVGQLKNEDAINADGPESVYFDDFRKNQRNEINIFSRKYKSIINNGKLSRIEK